MMKITFDYTHNEVWKLEVECWNEDETHAAQQSRLSFNELTNVNILCCLVAILLSTDAAAWLCIRRAL